MPALMPCDYTKADIPKLASDLQKWYSVMPSSAKEWWERFLDRVGNERNHAFQERDIADCPIYHLKHHLQRPRAEEVEDSEMNNELRSLREKELAPLEEVDIYIINLSQEAKLIPHKCLCL